MKKVKCAILGYGDRSYWYSQYAFDSPDELEIVAVIDINAFKLQQAQRRFGLKEEMLFDTLDAFLSENIKCDVVINGTMDEAHYETSVKLLNKGYNLLLEKPITGNPKELLEIERLANKNDCKVVVCHVLRYTPYYRKIKEIIDSGEIGKIVNMELNEHVWQGHFVNAYVRGKWRNEKACGSSFLLAKCCHDTDLMCWLNNNTKPIEVASFGKRATFCPENAPKGASEYCYTCLSKEGCMFNAEKFELEMDCLPQYTWIRIDKPKEQMTREEKIEYLKKDDFGKCVFQNDMDIVDRQSVMVNFENGSTATLNMVGGTTKAGRHTHIVCEYGEIEGSLEQGVIIYRKFNKDAVNRKYVEDKFMYTDTVIDVNKEIIRENTAASGHNGGDFCIMQDLVRFLNGEQTSKSTTVISDSIAGHLICYAAEASRKEKRIVSLQEFNGTGECQTKYNGFEIFRKGHQGYLL